EQIKCSTEARARFCCMTVSATVLDMKSSNFTLTTDRNFRRQTISMDSWRTCCHGSSHIYVSNGVFVLIYHFNEQCRCPGPRPATQAGVISQYQLNRCIRTSNNAKWLIELNLFSSIIMNSLNDANRH